MYVDLVLRALDAGLGDRLLLSHDRLGYDPATRSVWEPSYDFMHKVFVPKLAAAGVGRDTIKQITHDNPFRAYATRRINLIVPRTSGGKKLPLMSYPFCANR